jgi:hypothetical protein
LKKFILTLALVLALTPQAAFAQVPNHSRIPQQLFDSGQYNLLTPDGTGAFTDAVICALNKVDSNWGNLRKNSNQTNIHGHAEDAALYLVQNGLSIAVDFIGGSGGSDPRPGWIVDDPRYTRADWLEPHNCGIVPPVVTPPPAPVVDLSAVLERLDALTTRIQGLEVAAAATFASVGEVSAQLGGVASRVEAVLTSNDRIIRQMLSAPDYTGRVFGSPVTLRPTIRPVAP